MDRLDNIAVFDDTSRMCKTDNILKDSIKNSILNQKIIFENDKINYTSTSTCEKAEIVVSQRRTLEAASLYNNDKVCILNFASAVNPGGGVTSGCTAQEECLCRESTLYSCLNTKENFQKFYAYHRRYLDNRYNDDCVYTPDVTVFKSDKQIPETLPKDKWYNVNVITCAAPRLSTNKFSAKIKVTDKELLEIHKKRLDRILSIAAMNKNNVIILGAFGCGAFKNNPEIVARAAKETVKKYINDFKIIEFAVYCGKNKTNFDVFKRVLSTKF